MGCPTLFMSPQEFLKVHIVQGGGDPGHLCGQTHAAIGVKKPSSIGDRGGTFIFRRKYF